MSSFESARDDARAAWTFAMVDLAGYTALTEWHGDEQAADLATLFADLAGNSLGPQDRLIKPIGDAVLLASPTPSAGVTLVERLLTSCNEIDGFPVARAGLHHGPAAERAGDLFGAAVNLPARIAGHAAGGQVLATTTVAHAARELGTGATSLGALTFRNVGSEHEIFELDLCPQREATAIDPVCRMRVDVATAKGRLRHDDHDEWFCSLECAAAYAAEPDRFPHPS